jgi:transcriptional regulator of heat shock response
MRRTQNNYLIMAVSVLKHFANYVGTWINIKIIASAREDVSKTIDEINAVSLKQTANNPVGHTEMKEQTRDMLESVLYRIALRVRSYARMMKDSVLKEKTHFSRSSLHVMRVNDLCLTANALVDACMEHLGNLAEYQVDQAMLDRLRELSDETKSLYVQRENITDERSEATERLQQLFSQLREQIKTLDDLVEGYIDDDVFVSTYFNARRIHDLRGRHSKNEEEDNDPNKK